MAGERARACRAFTLVELLVSMAIILLLLVVLVGMVNQTGKLWRSTSGHIEEFSGARSGFEAMTRRISQATLNTYLDYVDSSGNPRTPANASSFVPARYARQSELRFLSGPGEAASNASSPPRPTHAVFFAAPLGFVSDTASYGGLENLLNVWGYYIEFNNNGSVGTNADGTGLNIRPPFVHSADRYRFRLMELMQPSESLSIYSYTSGNGSYKATTWFTDALAQKWGSHVLAENIVALVLLPKLSPSDQSAGGFTDSSLAPYYTYDSTGTNMTTLSDKKLDPVNQLPPVITVTMVAVAEASYNRLQGASTTMLAGLGLATLFQSAGDTKNPANPGYAQDLRTLTTNLQNSRLDYRVFTSDVSLKGAKWSRAQTN